MSRFRNLLADNKFYAGFKKAYKITRQNGFETAFEIKASISSPDIFYYPHKIIIGDEMSVDNFGRIGYSRNLEQFCRMNSLDDMDAAKDSKAFHEYILEQHQRGCGEFTEYPAGATMMGQGQRASLALTFHTHPDSVVRPSDEDIEHLIRKTDPHVLPPVMMILAVNSSSPEYVLLLQQKQRLKVSDLLSCQAELEEQFTSIHPPAPKYFSYCWFEYYPDHNRMKKIAGNLDDLI